MGKFVAVLPLRPGAWALGWEALLAEARGELPAIAARAHLLVKGRVEYSIRPGQDVAGSGGARLVMHATAPARADDRPHQTLRDANKERIR